MHGAGDGNIVFGDGLENYPDKGISPESFDILVANPPYAVKAFKPHMKLKNNSFTILDKISNDGSEIETLFVERISQLVKPEGIAAVILPISILSKNNESFIGARESILQNFLIKAIASFGSKTFGATGTNTVIVFLEKFKEPPKRLDLVHDSVDAIFDGRNLNDWEDDNILKGYLLKIEVEAADYLDFVSKSKNYIDWKNHEYFEQYYKAFVNGSEYKKRIKQKGFKRLTDKEKLNRLNQHFYEFASRIEKEKILYFALVYQQTTLIVASPNGEMQEKFLGYKWSDRKGQEGIQIISPGGMLYSENDRKARDTLSGLVRNSFYGKEYSIPGFEEYFYYLRLQDMIDFRTLKFNKVIKTSKSKPLKTIPGLINYRLSNDTIFEICSGDRVLADDVLIEGNIPIYSANVFEEFGRTNKQNLNDFSTPSILWGMDGDWMVNMIPAGQPFYPTDHCGVLRVHSDEIVPEYLAMALDIAGRNEKFSRTYRPSKERIKALIIQIPEDINIQKKLVEEVGEINSQIENKKQAIDKISDEIDSKYKTLLSNPEIPEKEIGNIASLSTTKIRLADFDSKNYVSTENMLQNKKGIVPYTGSVDNIDNVTKFSVGDILVSNIRPYLKKIWLADKDAGCSADVLVFHITDTSSIVPEYLYYSLFQDSFFDYLMEGKTGVKMPRGDKTTIPLYKIKCPNITLQNEFANFMKNKRNEQNKLSSDIEELKNKRLTLILRNFE